jgi:hypothetical protein
MIKKFKPICSYQVIAIKNLTQDNNARIIGSKILIFILRLRKFPIIYAKEKFMAILAHTLGKICFWLGLGLYFIFKKGQP